jgi:hypothetical protein
MFALEAYIAAVYPAGPEPIIRHFVFSIVVDINYFLKKGKGKFLLKYIPKITIRNIDAKINLINT